MLGASWSSTQLWPTRGVTNTAQDDSVLDNAFVLIDAFSQVTRSWGKEPIHPPGQPPGHIIRAAMIDKAHLIDKHILFRLQTIPNAIYGGIVRGVEADGFWIEAPALTGEMRRDAAWGHVVEQFQDPSLLFVPTTSLMLLIAAKE